MLKLADILRASHVSRWNIVNVSRHQSVAEHTFNVCMIARRLCKELSLDDVLIIKAALEHDLDEVIFGDLPSPIKAELMSKGVNINALVANEMRHLTQQQKIVIKVADLLDAVLFLQDHAMGTHAAGVLSEVEGRLERYMDNALSDGHLSVDWYDTIKRFIVNVSGEKL